MAAETKLFMDEDVHLSRSQALRRRGHDALHVREVQRRGLDDADQLDYAVKESRCLVTFNVGHFVRLHGKFLQADRAHFGIVVSKQLPLGQMLRKLLLFLQTHSNEEIVGNLHFL